VTNESQPQLPVPVIQTRSVRLWPLWFVIIILITVISALSAYGWVSLQKIDRFGLQLSHIEKDDGSQSRTLQQLENKITLQSADIIAQSRTLSEQLATHRKQIEHNARQLAQVGGQSRTDWLMAEAEYLMRLANQRFNMEKDFIGAEAILVAANSVLAETDDPGLYIVRQQLAKDILALQQVPRVDREGIYLQIEALIDLSNKLDQSHYLAKNEETLSPALALDETATQNTEESQFSQLLNQTLNEVKQLIIIRRLDEPVAPLLAPEQIYYLKQNLRLMLEQTELALLDRNQQMYEHSLKKAEEWVQTYFLASRDDTALILSTLKNLKEKEINPYLPDISQSLALMKKRVSQSYRQHLVPEANTNTRTNKKTNKAANAQGTSTMDGAAKQ